MGSRARKRSPQTGRSASKTALRLEADRETISAQNASRAKAQALVDDPAVREAYNVPNAMVKARLDALTQALIDANITSRPALAHATYENLIKQLSPTPEPDGDTP